MDKRHGRNLCSHTWLFVAALLAFSLDCAQGVILFRTADPSANTTAPTNDPAGSGWNYEGQFGGFLGTPIAPHFFLTAKHIGQAGSVFTFGATNYTLVTHFNDPFSDLSIWKVVETLPAIAPLYTNNNETGLRLVVIGKGTQRGSGVFVGPDLHGWYWGPGDGVQRWGENTVADVVNFSSGPDDAIYATFDQNGLPNESHLSGGDSGGAVFIEDGTVWKLAGLTTRWMVIFTSTHRELANSTPRYSMRAVITTRTVVIRRLTLKLRAQIPCLRDFTPRVFRQNSPGSIA
jgi:hypothetical protein